MIAWWCTSQTTRWCLHDDASVKSQDDYCMMMRLSNHKMIIIIIAWRCVSRTHTMPDPEIPDSRFIVYASKRRFVPVCTSLNRGFRGLHDADSMTMCQKNSMACKAANVVWRHTRHIGNRGFRGLVACCTVVLVCGPQTKFWKFEPRFQNACSKHFSRVWVPDLGYKTLKSASNTHSEILVRPSKTSFGSIK